MPELVKDVFAGRTGIYVRNINRVQVELDKVGVVTKKRLAMAIHKSVRQIAAGARRRAPRDTGALQSSINPSVPRTSKRGVIRGYVRARADYAAWVEFGTWKQTKKRIKAKLPNVKPGSPLYIWAVRHGIPPAALARSMARGETGGARVKNAFGRLIGRSRARSKGTEKRPYLGPAFVAERPKVYRRLINTLKGYKRNVG